MMLLGPVQRLPASQFFSVPEIDPMLI